MGTALAVVVGGSITLLGTLLANYLRYRAEKRDRKRERLSERMSEVRRFVMACLDFADTICLPLQLMGEKWGEAEYDEWKEMVSDQAQLWARLPAGGSSVVVFVEDDQLMELLREIARLTARFYVYYRWLVAGRSVPDKAVSERDQLRDFAEEARSRMDELVDKV